MRLSTIPELSREQLEKKFPRKGYYITFYPVEDGFPDPINALQIFVKLTESKAKELAELFERTNDKNDGLKITIEIFEIGDENA
jgi:hypothetical protein